MSDNDLKWAVEAAALRAWPGLEQRFVMGWEARFAGGHTKRANSASPWPPAVMLAERMDACEAEYTAAGQPAIFKLPEMLAPEADQLLARRGYTVAEPTLVMVREPDNHGAEPARSMPLGPWLAAWSTCRDAAQPPAQHRLILETRMDDAIFACQGEEQAPFSCGLAVMDRWGKGPKLCGIFDVTTRAQMRRKGHASGLVHGLMAAAAEAGAELCYLQVVESNQAAVALYTTLGFRRLFRYWYRVQPEVGPARLASGPRVP